MTLRDLPQTSASAGAPVSRPMAGEASLAAAAGEAFVYALPLIEMAAVRRNTLGRTGRQNALSHQRDLIDHRARWVTTPNNDTLYSIAWLDLTQGAVRLTIPQTGGRYFSAALMDMFTNNNAVLGTRTIGNAGGTFTIIGPDQTGSGPDVVRVATAHAWLLIRILIDGHVDLAAARQVQDGFKLEGPSGSAPNEHAARNDAAPALFASIQSLMASDPPPATDTAVLRRIAAALQQPAPAAADAIAEGVAAARSALMSGGKRLEFIEGWSYPRANLGNFDQDYRYRAAVALWGIGALPVAEAMYMRAAGNLENGFFDGTADYQLHLPARLPLNGFWSLTMYEVADDNQLFLTENSLGRYAIGDRTDGLRRNADGSITLWIGRGDPGGDRTANWLPAPKRGPFSLITRCYLPRQEMLSGRWRLPPVREAGR
ncbi:DUF1254 domain-containing protein [Bradyrhizobium mercantei]|uniref:DUF1254 domain-containing protein n=1 Tax=Bradyrhizobium mercantei TaxID=1904807 RepID=UPI000976BE6D|nr:DUF1254 domain-containing protein [Bradyrhizobium mercantei]